MRDFRDAKTMAQTLREALNAKSVTLTNSESLELIARLFGLHDWNVLAARIQSDRASPEVRLQDNLDNSGKPPRREIALDAAILDGYVGLYQLNDNAVLTVTREGTQLLAQLTGQGAAPIYPENQTRFFYKVIDAQISFINDAKGQATSLILHQGGGNIPMERIDAATAQRIVGKTAEKVKSQFASPGTEAALGRLIDGIISGKPDYDEMSPAMAEATRHQLPDLQPGLATSGAVRSIKFLGVGLTGEDAYSVRHENGASHWRIALDSQGKISTAWVTPGP